MVLAQKQIHSQWNRRIENLEINTYTYGQLFFNKVGKNIQ